MRSVGVDLAVRVRKTGVVDVMWDGHGAGGVVQSARSGATDEHLLAILADGTVDVIGIDAPLGWPDEFIAAVSAHHQGNETLFSAYDDWDTAYASMRLRATDQWVRDETGLTPISVSADKIAAPAMRAVWLLAQASDRGVAIDRSGCSGRVVEVYPAAAMTCWQIRATGYKNGPNAPALRQQILAEVTDRMHLTLTTDLTDDHQVDALICAVVAHLARTDRTRPIPPDRTDTAEREGWIHLPRT